MTKSQNTLWIAADMNGKGDIGMANLIQAFSTEEAPSSLRGSSLVYDHQRK